jgi:hypothetical protein
MSIGGGNSEYILFIGISNHFQKIRIEVRFPLKIKDKEGQIPINLVYCFSKKIDFKGSRFSGKLPQSTGAFRTTQITGSRRFNG